MPALDLEIMHRGRREDRFQAAGNPKDAAWLAERLREWLAAHKWQQSRWGEFELIARPAGRGKQLARVRA
jgi:hypothetical protein